MNTDILNRLPALENDILHFAMKLTQNNTEDAQDLMQEAFLRMIKNADSYLPDTNLKAWSFTIVRNTFINLQRRREVEHCYAECQRETCEIYDDLYEIMDSSSLYSVLNELTPEMAVPLKMFADGYKYCEIAERLGVPLTIVRNRIHAARQRLKSMLKE